MMRRDVRVLPEPPGSLEPFIREHRHFRAKFAAMSAAGHLWPESKWVIREVGFSLLRQLQLHSQREARLATACYLALGRAGSSELQRLSIDHSVECRTLRHINRGLDKPIHEMPQYISFLIQQASDQCSHQIVKQERQFFPLLECVLRLKRSEAGNPGACQAGLDSAMTGSEVVERFPAAREVFESLSVDIGLEGYYPLEEIAVRRGLRSRQLLEALERGIGAAEDTHQDVGVYHQRPW